MSAAQMQNEGTEVAWGGLESLGLSQKELVLAEALQMEYDALSRLKQDQSETEAVHIPSRPNNPSLCVECPQSTTYQHRSDLRGGSLLSGLSGSGPSPNQLGGSESPPSIPPRVSPPRGDHNKQCPFILVGSEPNKVKDSNIGDIIGSEKTLTRFVPKCLNPLSDEIPPAVPPRIPLNQSAWSENPFLLTQDLPVLHNVNLFLPHVDQPKKLSGEVNYDSINDSLLRLNSLHGSGGYQSKGDHSGKPVTRSKTLPPQIPPRTRAAVLKCNKIPQQVPTDVVRGFMNRCLYDACLILTMWFQT